MVLSIIHTYASKYGWNRDYILENVFIDEHFILQEIINQEERQKYLMLSHIQLLPHLKDDAREQFINSLSSDSESERLIDKENVKTDFEAIKQAKQKLISGGVL